MDPFAGNSLQGIAQLVIEKWYAAMGLIGLLLFAAAMVVDVPVDRPIVICVSLIMFGFGFGQTECRTFKEAMGPRFIIVRPVWRWTVLGILLFAIGTGAAIKLAFLMYSPPA